MASPTVQKVGAEPHGPLEFYAYEYGRFRWRRSFGFFVGTPSRVCKVVHYVVLEAIRVVYGIWKIWPLCK